MFRIRRSARSAAVLGCEFKHRLGACSHGNGGETLPKLAGGTPAQPGRSPDFTSLSHLLLRLIRHSFGSIAMTLKLSTLSILLGLGLGLPQIYGVMKPKEFGASVRKFPRNVPVGIALMLLGTAWFLWILSKEAVSDFATYKSTLFILFAAVGIGSCVFVQDFLAVRGLAVLFLLLAKLMVDTGRPMLGTTHWTLVIQTWAYIMVLIGIWLTVSPWRLRDFLNWATANENRVRVGSAIRLAFGLFVAVLGLTKFH